MIEAAVILSAVLEHGGLLHHPRAAARQRRVGFWEERQAGKAIEALKASWPSRPG